jgi:hypothetical protein
MISSLGLRLAEADLLAILVRLIIYKAVTNRDIFELIITLQSKWHLTGPAMNACSVRGAPNPGSLLTKPVLLR